MKKVLSFLLICVMLVSLLPTVGVAAEERIVLLEANFEAEAVDASPKNSGFDSVVATDIACLKVVDDAGNHALKAWHGDHENPEEKARGPRMDLNFSLKGLTNLRIEYDVKSSGGETELVVGLAGTDNSKNGGSIKAPYNFEDWTHILIEVDVSGQSATYYADDTKKGTTKLNFGDESTMILRLKTTVELDGSYVMLDNFKLSTTDKGYALKQGMSAEDLKTEYKAENAVAETGNVVSIVDVDFEDLEVGSLPKYEKDGGFTTGAVTDIACMRVENDNGGKVIRCYHGDPVNYPETRSPRLVRAITKTGLTKMTIDYDVKSSLGETELNIDFLTSSTNKYISKLKPPSAFKDWTHVKIRCDFEAMKAVIYVGGREYATRDIGWGEETSFNIRVSAACATDGSYVMLDNFKITSPDLELGGAISVSGEKVYWDKLKLDPKQKTGMLEVMRMEHPRILVTDWDALRAKADSSPTYQTFKAGVLLTANGALNTDPTAYVRGSTGTINSATSTVKRNAISLAGAYKLTGDVRYKDRLYAELEAAGNWPDWGSESFLCTAHMNFGVAVAYDWLYYDWTEEERANILNWLLEQGLSQAVLAYEGFISASWKTGASNWNNVCNGSNLIAALAIAESYPDVTDYILAKAATAIPYMFSELNAEGAYVEPLGYWDYGIGHLVCTMAALDTSLAPGQTLPACLNFEGVTGMNNTGDFPIYYNGAANGFNYGDGDDALKVTPILYYLATKYNKPQYAWYERNMRENNPYISEAYGMDAMYSLIWYDEAHAQNGGGDVFPLDKFYTSDIEGGAKALSMRSSWIDQDALIVMAIAGDMAAGHSHQNAGGFVLDYAGTRWVHMYGRAVPGKNGTPYDWDNYFLSAWEGGRYDYYHTRGEANNTIIANPQQNRADMNINYVTKLERFDSSASKAFGIMDLTDTNKDYLAAKRGFMLTNNRETLVIQDEITATKPSEYYWFMNTHAEITVAPDGKSAMLEQKGAKMLVRITQGPADAKIGIMPAQPRPTSPDPDVQPDIEEHKLFIHVQNQQNLQLTVEITGLKDGEGIPQAQPVVALEQWSVDDAPALTTSLTLGDVVALKVDNPNAYAKGSKTYVDTENLGIKPIVQNGRTLVPVRFIAEKFGAKVGWEDATQTVTVTSKAGTITLKLGSNEMNVNGNVTVLDVPAQEIGGRTLIPLRALVEALGKQVFWDDRGLILISDTVANYDAATIDKIIDLLDIRVQADGNEIKFFDSEIYEYDVKLAKGAAVPNVTVISDKEATVVQGNPATVTVGDKTYTFRFAEDVFEGVLGTGSAGVIKNLNLFVDNGSVANYQTYLDIVSASSSIEWDEKYVMNGTYDGIINASVTQNRWSANGADQWIAYDLGAEKNLHSIAIAGYKTDGRSYTFKISVSNDGKNWTTVNEAAETTMGIDRTVVQLGDVKARYIRLDGLKATNTTWMGICEVRIYDSAQMEADDQACWNAYFYTSTMMGKAGQTLRLCIEGESALGEILPVNIADVKLTSLNPEIASVDASGNVTLHKAGATRIRAEAMINGILKTTTIEVEVN